MLNIWIGHNKVLPNLSMGDVSGLDQSCDFDCSLTEVGNHSIDVLLGKNGSGKSFIGKTLVYLAYVYYYAVPLYRLNLHARQAREMVKNMDVDLIVRSLDDARIGSVDDVPKDGCISLKTSYNGRGRDNFFEERYYNVRLGISAQNFFRANSIVFYSNSQFPSNDFFFSVCAASYSATNVDLVFWNLRNDGTYKRKLKIALWQNKTLELSSADLFSPENVESLFSNQDGLDSTMRSVKYIHRNIFIFDPLASISWTEIQQSKIYEILKKQYESRVRNPVDYVKLEAISLKEYYILLLICRRFDNVNFELYKDSVREKYLSSKERYDLVLDCLMRMSVGRCFLIIDEPENSTHLKIQKKIAQELPPEKSVLAMTHSPEFVIGLKNQSRNVHVWSICQGENGKIIENVDKSLITDSLDTTAANFFGFAPNLEKWNERNVGEDLGNLDLDALMPFDSFYDAIRNLDLEQ